MSNQRFYILQRVKERSVSRHPEAADSTEGVCRWCRGPLLTTRFLPMVKSCSPFLPTVSLTRLPLSLSLLLASLSFRGQWRWKLYQRVQSPPHLSRAALFHLPSLPLSPVCSISIRHRSSLVIPELASCVSECTHTRTQLLVDISFFFFFNTRSDRPSAAG